MARSKILPQISSLSSNSCSSSCPFPAGKLYMVEVYTMLTQGMWATSDLGTSDSLAIFLVLPLASVFPRSQLSSLLHPLWYEASPFHLSATLLVIDAENKPRQQWLLVVNKPLIKPSLLEGSAFGGLPHYIYLYISHMIFPLDPNTSHYIIS